MESFVSLNLTNNKGRKNELFFFERRLFFYGSNALGTENKNKFPLEHAFCFFTIKK
ncbi:hypothetical protein CU002_2147 [Enterococcus faecium]|nr:hypothetical protein [Enterococcus faecium]